MGGRSACIYPTLGRLSKEKRQDVIINALKYSKYGDRIQLVFAGKGPESIHRNRMESVDASRWSVIRGKRRA